MVPYSLSLTILFCFWVFGVVSKQSFVSNVMNSSRTEYKHVLNYVCRPVLCMYFSCFYIFGVLLFLAVSSARSRHSMQPNENGVGDVAPHPAVQNVAKSIPACKLGKRVLFFTPCVFYYGENYCQALSKFYQLSACSWLISYGA